MKNSIFALLLLWSSIGAASADTIIENISCTIKRYDIEGFSSTTKVHFNEQITIELSGGLLSNTGTLDINHELLPSYTISYSKSYDGRGMSLALKTVRKDNGSIVAMTSIHDGGMSEEDLKSLSPLTNTFNSLRYNFIIACKQGASDAH